MWGITATMLALVIVFGLVVLFLPNEWLLNALNL